MPIEASAEPRAVCARCRRPESVCYCRHLASLQTATRVVILQHPRERDVPIGTARMAALCLPGAELHVGVSFHGSTALARALSDPSRPAALLYPGPGAIDVVRHPPASPVTLIVVDGTWSQARKLVREHPELQALPRYAFTPPAPSEYRIRREPDEQYVSTIEALVLVLGALEGDPVRYQALLDPFRAMVETQLACARRLHHGRKRRMREPRPLRPRVPACLGDGAELVCVGGEANAWPARPGQREVACPDELIQWVAVRLSTNERFQFVLAPRKPLSPRTPSQIGLPLEVLLSGGSEPAMRDGWRAFVRDTDLLCSWGQHAVGLLDALGGYLPPARLDLREVARGFAGGKVGTIEAFCAALGAEPASGPAPVGRAESRLSELVRVTRHLAALARSASA